MGISPHTSKTVISRASGETVISPLMAINQLQ